MRRTCEITEKAQEMLCALVGTETIRGQWWLVFSFSQLQTLFQLGGLDACPRRGLPVPQLSPPRARLSGCGEVCEGGSGIGFQPLDLGAGTQMLPSFLLSGFGGGDRVPGPMLKTTMLRVSPCGQMSYSRLLGFIDHPEPIVGGIGSSKYSPASFVVLCPRRQARPEGTARRQALVSPLLM